MTDNNISIDSSTRKEIMSTDEQRRLDYLLFQAVLQRPPDYEAALRARNRGANVNAEFESEGIYPVDVASVNNNQELMRFLINNGANPNQRAFDGMSPLHRAVILGNSEMVQLLLEHGKADADLPTAREGQESLTPLQMVVAQNGRVPIARLLVEYGADVHARRLNGRTLLHLVESVDMLDFLLNVGLKVDETRDNGCTALHHACVSGNLPIVQRLVKAGGDPNVLSQSLFSPLHYACHEGHLDIVKWLISHGGGNPYARGDHGCVSLHVACMTKQQHVACWLMDECNMPPSLTNRKGYDALHYACKQSPENQDAIAIVKELLRRDPTLGKGDAYSVPSALHFASEWSPALCRLLVNDYGFDLMARSMLGSVPLSHATAVGTVKTIVCLVELMKEKELDLNVGDVRGLTSLHEAILGGYLDKVHALLDCGLDANAVSQCGETPLHAASLTSGHVDDGPKVDQKKKALDNERQQSEILQAVIDRGAYPLRLDDAKMYPFMYSAKKSNVTKTFLLLRAAASQGFFGNPATDSIAQKRALEQEQKDLNGTKYKRRRLNER